MNAFIHRNFGVELGSTNFDTASKPRSTGGSVRLSHNGGARLFLALAVLLAFLLGVLAGALPAQAQSPSADGPSAPQQLTATTEDGGIVLSWSAPADSGASGIRYYQIRNAEGVWIPSDIPWISVGSLTSGAFRSLTNGTLYTSEVRAVNDHGHGPAATIQAIPNIPTTVSVSPVQATVTEGSDAVFRFSRVGRTAERLSVGINVSGHWKVMDPFTRLLTLNNGLSGFTTVVFAEGVTEVTRPLASEADSDNEGDGEISVRIRNALEYDVAGTGRATVLVEDDDIPVVSLRWISPPMTVQGNTWVGSMVEGEDIEYEVECTGGTLAPDGEVFRIPVHVREELNHPVFTHYGRDFKVRFPCSDQPREGYLEGYNVGGQRYVGPDNGRIKIDILPQVRDMADFPGYVLPINRLCYGSPADVRFCPKFSFGSVTAVDIEVLNRNPTITVEAVDEEVNEGEPARFKLTRIWTSDLLNPDGLLGASTSIDFAISAVGGYVSSPQNGQETFGASETEIIVEIPTVNDGVTGDDGQVTFEILAGSEETQSGNIGGHYEVYDHIDGITPPGGNSRKASVRILNRTEPGVAVSETALTVPEGDSRTYTVALLSQPTGPVTVTPSAAGDPDVTVRPAALTFTASTWSQAQTVTVSAAQDGDAADDAATVSHAVSGGGYDAVAAADVAVAVQDDDTASTAVALSVLPEAVDEDAGATTVAVTGTLDAAPRTSDTDVSVSVSAGTASAGDFTAVPGFTLTIPAGETEGTASFSLAPVNDAIDEDAETISVNGTVQGLTVTAATVTIADDDTAGVEVSETALTVPEGDSRSYTVALLSQPTGPVTVTPSAAGDPDVTVRPAALTFTASTWSQAQTVTVSAAQDGDAADDAATVSHAVSGGGYDAVAAADVAVAVEDDDTASTVVALSVLPEAVDEDAGATAVAVTATLDAAPRTSDTDVSVSVSAGTASAGDFTAVPGFTLTIPAGATEGTASFSLAPVNDAIDEDAETISVNGTVPGLTVTAATVTIADDDTAGVAVSETALTVPEGDSRSYTVALLSQPTGPVTVTPSAAGDPDVTVRPAALTFTASTWSQAQTVTVSAAQDGDAADDAATVSHAVSGGGYDAVAAADVAVAVEDDDTASTVVALSVLPEAVDEGAGATTVAVTATLDAAPRTSDTDVSVSVSAGTASAGDFTAVPGFTLTIPAGDTEGTASFSLAPVNDAIDEDAETISVNGTVPGLTVTAATVTIADDDTAGVEVSETALTVPEGDSRSYTVALLSQPAGPVTVTPSAAGDPDVTVRPAALTFTASTWSQAQTVTVSAAQDGDAVDDAATVSHAVSGGGYDAVAAADVAVAVEDDDTSLQAPVLTVAWPGFEQVRLVWTAPARGGTSITGYEVHVERVDDGSVVHDWEPAGATLEHTVTGLENEVEYRFRVRAVNQSGPGAPSNPLTATPVSLVLTIVPHDDVDTIVEGEYARFDILLSSPLTHWIELDVRYTYTGEMMLNPISRETIQLGPRWQASSLPRVVATLDDSAIEPDGSVTLSLLPGDGYGVGELSSATIRVLDNDGGRAPAAPAAPTVSALSPTVLEATWSPPLDQGNPGSIESYDVQYRKAGEADWLDGPVGVTVTRAVLEGLETGTSYEVRVLARNARNPRNPDSVHAENWSVPGVGSTAPSAAVTVSVAEPSGSPQAREGDVLAFIVTADPPPASDLRVEVVVSESGAMLQAPSPSEVTIAAGTSEVVLEVATVDDATHETASNVFVVIAPSSSYDRGEPVARRHVSDNDAPGPDGIPGKPRNPHAEPMSDTELRLTWDWPQDIAPDQITSWVVTWTVEPCGQASPSWAAAQALPAGTGDPTEFVLTVGRAAAAHFRVAALLADAEIGPWSEPVCADTTTLELFKATGARVVNGPGSNGIWDEGETVEAELSFNRPVWVDDSNGRPSLAIVLDGVRREAPWVGGGGTSTLHFAYPVTANEAGARVVGVFPNGLSLNGATVHDAEGRHAPEHFDVTPVVTAVTVEAEADGLWSPGDEVRVHVTFNERVTVDTQGGRPSLGIMAGAATEVRAVYAGGSESRELVFGYVIPETAGPASSVVVLANTLALEGGAMHRGELAADLRHPGARLDGTLSGPVPAFSVADASAPEGGRLAFAVTLVPASLETVTVAYATSDESAIAGTDYARAAGRLTFAPGQTRAVAEVAVHEDRIDEGVETLTFTLSGPSGAAIAKAQATGRIVDASALMASFEDVPEQHGGSNVFGLRLVFSEPVFDGSEPFDKNQAIQDALQVSGGTVSGRRRVDPGAFDQWIFWIRPSGHGDVTVSLPATTGGCSTAGAICTPDGEALSNTPSATIRGPAGLSVADAEVQESPGAALAFAVTLSRTSSAAVTVDYATADGSATAGLDYAATSGTLTFAAGETAKTVIVPVLDDTIDEGSETLTVTLSNVSGAYLADATATGTIRNSDLMPQAWLARFGRTVADQVVDAVQDRLQGPPAAGVQVTLAGERISIGSEAAPVGEDSASGSGAGAERSDRHIGYRPLEPRELLNGSSFQLTAERDGAGSGVISLWGRGAQSGFDGREGDLSLSGEVTGAMLGADWTGGPASGTGAGGWNAGLMLSHTLGEGSYRGASAGTVESTVTGLYPYGRYQVNDRVTVWGVAGYGAGTLTLTPEGQTPVETDMHLTMAAAGLRGVLAEAPAEGGPEVSVETDALAVRTRSEALRSDAGNLAAASGDATRLRLGLDGTWRGLEVAGGTLEPTLELGVRHDGGEVETGFGLDAGAGLAWSHPENGLKLRLSGRGILTHESSGFREQGVSGSLAWQPHADRGRGPSLAVTQTLGGASTGGADALLGRRTLAGLAVGDDGNPMESRRLELRFGFGFGALGDRFTSTPELGFGMSNGHREYSLGWRFNRDMRGDAGSLEFSAEATRREAANDNAGAAPEHTAGFRMTARW